jgi:hypothetical protein
VYCLSTTLFAQTAIATSSAATRHQLQQEAKQPYTTLAAALCCVNNAASTHEWFVQHMVPAGVLGPPAQAGLIQSCK